MKRTTSTIIVLLLFLIFSGNKAHSQTTNIIQSQEPVTFYTDTFMFVSDIIDSQTGGYFFLVRDHAYNYRLIRYNEYFKEEWAYLFDYDSLNYYGWTQNNMLETSDSALYICFETQEEISRIVLSKFSANGEFVWQKYYSDSGQSHSNGLAPRSHGRNGFLLLLGGCYGQSHVCSCDSSGKIIWNYQYWNFGEPYPSVDQATLIDDYYLLTSQIENTNIGFHKIDTSGYLITTKLISMTDNSTIGFSKVLYLEKAQKILVYFSAQSGGLPWWAILDKSLNIEHAWQFDTEQNADVTQLQIKDAVYADSASITFSININIDKGGGQTAFYGGLMFIGLDGEIQKTTLVMPGDGYDDMSRISCLELKDSMIVCDGSDENGAYISLVNNDGEGFCDQEDFDLYVKPLSLTVSWKSYGKTGGTIVDTTCHYGYFTEIDTTREMKCGILSNPETHQYINRYEQRFVLFPNPAKDEIIITQAMPNSNIEIYSLLGEYIISRKSEGTETKINIQDLTVGTYIIKISNKNGTSSQVFEKIK